MTTMIHHHHLRSGLPDHTDTALVTLVTHSPPQMSHSVIMMIPDNDHSPPDTRVTTIIVMWRPTGGGDQDQDDAIQETDTHHHGVVTLPELTPLSDADCHHCHHMVLILLDTHCSRDVIFYCLVPASDNSDHSSNVAAS